MFHVPTHYPRSAIRRIRAQVIQCPPMKSCQQEAILWAPTYAALVAYLANPLLAMDLILIDISLILPYTTLDFNIEQDAPAFANQPYLFSLFLTAADTTRAKSAVTLAGQINACVDLYRQQFPDMGSLRAVASGDYVRIYMPWGMLGAAAGSYTGPDAPNGWTDGPPGVDNPIVYGILGKRRHIFAAQFPYRDDYYGDAPDEPPA